MAMKKGEPESVKVTKAATGEVVTPGAEATQTAAQNTNNGNPVSKQNAENINRIYANDPNSGLGPYDREYTAESAKGYVPKDTTTVNNSMYYAKEQNMTDADRASLVNAGVYYNEAKAAGNEAGMKEAHDLAERIRAKYGYSGGADGSEFISDRVPDNYTGGGGDYAGGSAPKKDVEAPQVDPLTNRAPDLTGLLDSWLASSKTQAENKIDYAVNQGVTELQRAEQDAQEQFQTQQNQVDANEARALDNQALYAEARGDRGGIGQAQYAQIQANAMTNRRTINSARTKLATDTARQIADLRAQGEFQKADAVLELAQTYLAQMMDNIKWGAEFNLSVDQFNAQIAQWNHEFELKVGEVMGNYQGSPTLNYQQFLTSNSQWEQEFQASQDRWNKEFDFTTQQAAKDEQATATSNSAKAGWALLEAGIIPSTSQLQAMGITKDQAQEFVTAMTLAQSSKGSGGGSGGTLKEKEPSVSETIKTFNTEAEVRAYLVDNKITGDRAEECWQIFYDNQELKESQPSAAMQEQEKLQAMYGTSFTQALAWANTMLANKMSDEEIESRLKQFSSSSLNPVGAEAIMQFIKEKRANLGG